MSDNALGFLLFVAFVAFGLLMAGTAVGAGAGPLTVTRGHTLGIYDATAAGTTTGTTNLGAVIIAVKCFRLSNQESRSRSPW